ncbi:UNVERIFIED_CONTAM: Kinesin-like protein kif2a [Siphonaria sp. JEL0065]|nr:Kinesin-like protein kif2a [Siphonaria sp. JEL0065]
MDAVGSDEQNFEEEDVDARIRVCVRKRPMNKKEHAKDAYDIVTTSTTAYPNSHIYIHEPKTRVDMSKYTETHPFIMDHSFDETSTNEQVYIATGKPLVKSIFEGGMCTFFAYGQTEPGIYSYICRDIFTQIQSSMESTTTQQPHLLCSFFEIYGPKINDLLAPPPHNVPISLCEDKHGSVNLMNLHQETITSLPDLLALVQRGRSLRTTRATNTNSESSRSHALFQIKVVSGDETCLLGVLSLVDLAGSERGMDSVGLTRRDKKIQTESAEINKSLLSLKECIRALYRSGQQQLGGGDIHVPFRGSKLTHILRDSFLCRESRTVMVATISPGSGSVEHTLNTLRYADRVKELGNGGGRIHAVVPSVLKMSSGSELERSKSPLKREATPLRNIVESERQERSNTQGLDSYEEDVQQQTISELQKDRNLVSSLGNYGQSDSEEEKQSQHMSTRVGGVESYNDMNALRNLIQQSKLAVREKEVLGISRSLEQTQLLDLQEKEDERNTRDEASDSDDGDSDYFYQDALSVDGSPGATDGESDEVNELKGDVDEAEWRQYCTNTGNSHINNNPDSDSELSLRNRHTVRVQEQLMEIDNLLLERVRSGRMGIGAYVTQLSELLAQRVDALRRSTK